MSVGIRVGAKAWPSPSGRWQQDATLGHLCPFLSYPGPWRSWNRQPQVPASNGGCSAQRSCRWGFRSPGPLESAPKAEPALQVPFSPVLLLLGTTATARLGVLATKHRNSDRLHCERTLEVCLPLAVIQSSISRGANSKGGKLGRGQPCSALRFPRQPLL